MKRTLLRITFVLLLIGAGYAAYYYVFKPKTDVWRLVPEDALIIAEVDQIGEKWEEISNSAVYKLIDGLQFKNRTEHELSLVDSVMRTEGYNLHDLLDSKLVTFSIHQKEDGSFATLIYLPVRSADESYLSVVNNYYKGNSSATKTINFEDKWYMGYEQADYSVYAYNYENIIILSASNELIRKAIYRTTKIDENDNIIENKRLHDKKEANTSPIRLYAKTSSLLSDLKPYFEKETYPFLESLARFGDNIFLDVRLREDNISFSGFLHGERRSQSFINVFSGQNSNNTFPENYTSARTAVVNFWTISDQNLFDQKLVKQWWDRDAQLAKDRTEIEENYKVNISNIVAQVRGQMMYALLNNHIGSMDKVMVLELENSDAMHSVLDEVAYKVNSSSSLKEKYQGDQILELQIANLPALMFGDYYSGFENSFYTINGNYLILSDTKQGLKFYLDDINNSKTWNKSISKSILVEDKFTDYNSGFFVDVNATTDYLRENLNERGKELYNTYIDEVALLDKVVMQTSYDDKNRFYTDFFISIADQEKQQKEEEEVLEETIATELFSTEFDTTIITKPIVVKNYKTKTLNVLIQDANYKLYQVSKSGDIQWSKQLNGKIIEEAYELDFYKNGKLQYLIATENKVYLIDRLGNVVEGYPFSLPDDASIKTISLFDYDESRNYRILLSDDKGNLFLHTKEGKLLDGWNPLKLKGPVVNAPQHLRVRGKDFILAVEKGGRINLYNRRGEMKDNFPIELGYPIYEDVNINLGRSFNSSLMSVLDHRGTLHTYTITGKRKEETYFIEGDTMAVLNEVSGSGFVVRSKIGAFEELYAQDSTKLVALNDSLSTVQYYEFDDKKVFFSSNPVNGEFSILTPDAVLLETGDVYSQHDVGVLYSKRNNIFRVYKVYENTLQLIQIKAF